MKKIIIGLMVIAMVATSICFAPDNVQAKKRFRVTTTSGLYSIKLKWTKNKKAKKYVIYRAKSKSEYRIPKKSKYKRIKATKGTKYLDKKAKRGCLYCYYVNAINKKGKKIATTFLDGYAEFRCKGLETPEFLDAGYGENYVNTRSKLYFYATFGYNGYGYKGHKKSKKVKFAFYRRELGKKKYKRIKLRKTKDDFYCDNKVESGKTYQYYAKTYVKTKKRTYYSKASSKVELSAVNFRASYKIQSLTKPGEYKGVDSIDVEFKVTKGNNYDGKTVFYKTKSQDDGPQYCCYENKGTKEEDKHYYNFCLTHYSADGKKWIDIPKGGVQLPKTKALYLKGKISLNSEEAAKEDKTIIFGGNNKKYYCSNIICEEQRLVEYFGSGSGVTYAYFDLIAGAGSAYQEWD